MQQADLERLLPEIIALADAAGAAIMPYFNDKLALNVQHKQDKSPVTDADFCANQCILKGLTKLDAKIPIISEESPIADFVERQQWDYSWLVDPLDGTKGFLNGSGEFTVNISLIHQHQPILGVIYAPVKQVCYYAARGIGAFRRGANANVSALHCASLDQLNQMRVVLGQYHTKTGTQSLVETVTQQPILRVNSSIKFGWIAETKADCYPRFGPTGEWDTAAGHCIVEQAGGIVVDLEGYSLQYNASESVINPAFVALSDKSLLGEVLQILEKRRKQ